MCIEYQLPCLRRPAQETAAGVTQDGDVTNRNTKTHSAGYQNDVELKTDSPARGSCPLASVSLDLHLDSLSFAAVLCDLLLCSVRY